MGIFINNKNSKRLIRRFGDKNYIKYVNTTPAPTGIILSTNSTPRALIGGGTNYIASFINSDYRAYFSNIINQTNEALVNGSLPYDNIHGKYLNNTNSYGYPWYYNFIVPTIITKYRLWNAFKSGVAFTDPSNGTTRYSDYGNQTPQGWKLQGSLDGTSWTDVDSRTSQARLPYATSSDPSTSAYNEYTISSPAAYKVYRFLVTAGGRNAYNCDKTGSYCDYDWQLGQLQLWGYESPSTSCGLHGYYGGLPTAKYITSSGALSSISTTGGNYYSFSYAFYNSGFLGHDSRTRRTWDHYYRINYTPVGQYKTEYIGFDFPIVLNAYNIRCIGSILTSWDIYGSNDLSSYTLLDSRTGQNTSSISTTFSFSNSTGYKYFKFVFKDGTQGCNKDGCTWTANIADIVLRGTLI